jgi:hypothetical protein
MMAKLLTTFPPQLQKSLTIFCKLSIPFVCPGLFSPAVILQMLKSYKANLGHSLLFSLYLIERPFLTEYLLKNTGLESPVHHGCPQIGGGRDLKEYYHEISFLNVFLAKHCQLKL